MIKYDETYFNFLKEGQRDHEKGLKTWIQIRDEFNAKFGESLSEDAIRGRCNRSGEYKTQFTSDGKKMGSEKTTEEYTEYNSDGTVEASTIVNDIKKFGGDKFKLLEYLGYKPDEWELLKLRISLWNGGKDGKTQHAVKYKVKPLINIQPNDFAKAALDAIKKSGIDEDPLHLKEHRLEEKVFPKKRKLMEIPPVELHLGKIGSKVTTGEDYNVEIAKNRFYDIFQHIYEKQKKENCQNCLLVIGSDFFNSESDNATSTHKIPQQNCAHYIDLFKCGVEMYSRVILKLRTLFNKVDVILCAGNHARAMEFFLYVALQQAFKNDTIVKFKDGYQETTYFEFGSSVIFFNHGDVDLKRTMQSIPSEYSQVWGKHKNRELHLGHLHKETVVDDELGMITRRIGSPCGTDMWHKLNRWVGATKKHQIFIWDYDDGLTDINYIPTKY